MALSESANPFNVKTGQRVNMSEIEFNKFAQNGKMTISLFKEMCSKKNYEDFDAEEIEAAFVRLNTSASGYITYQEYLVWWKTGIFDDSQRHMGLKFQSLQEKNEVTRARCSFMEGTGGFDGMTQEQFRLKCYIAGYCLSDEELEDAFLLIDKDNDGRVDFIEYLRWRMQDDRFTHLQQENENDVYIHQIAEFFRMYDTLLKGYLSVEQFTPLYESLVDAGRVQAPLEEIVELLDADGKQIVKLNDFVIWYSQNDGA